MVGLPLMIKILFNCIIHLNIESQVRTIHVYFSVIFIFIYKKRFDSGTPFNSSDIWTTGGGNMTFCPTCEDRRHWETAASQVLSALWERTVLSKHNTLKRKTICKLGGHELWILAGKLFWSKSSCLPLYRAQQDYRERDYVQTRLTPYTDGYFSQGRLVI